MSFSDVHPGDPINATNVQQVIDALKGTSGKGIPLAVSAVNDSARYALTLENTEATNSRALNVLKNDGSVLIRADATGVTLGAPLNLPTGSVTTTAIADGTIATADLANQSVTNAKLGTDTARSSLLTNGGFEIWQRGNGPFTGSAYNADRWYQNLTGSDTLSVSLNTANADVGSNRCAACTFTLSGGTFTSLQQTLKSGGALDYSLTGRPVSLSIRVRTSTANAVRLFFTDGTTTLYSGYHSGGGAYETLTIANHPNAAASPQLGVQFVASCTAYLDNAMLVVGSVPADYAPLHPADDLARCLRYYESVSCTNNGAMLPAMAYGAANAQFLWSFKVAKAVAPTITSTPAGQAALLSATGTALTATAVDSFVANPGQAQGRVAVASGLVAGNATQVIAGSGTSAILWAESNP